MRAKAHIDLFLRSSVLSARGALFDIPRATQASAEANLISAADTHRTMR